MKLERLFGLMGLLLSGWLSGAGCANSHTQPTESASRDWSRFEQSFGAVIRGDPNQKSIAISFTGHEFAEGGETILNELQRHHAKGSFFLTGKFVTNPAFRPLLQRIAAEGHYFSVHSDKHLLYCSWDKARQTLVSKNQFQSDLKQNFARFSRLQLAQQPGRYFIPPYEHYNQQIVAWADQMNATLINYTPGTRSHADYTSETDRNFTSSQTILDSIIKREKTDPHGLNGYILLMHIGSGPARVDKFSSRFAELLDYLAAAGYEFVRVDELLAPQTKP